MPLLGDALTLLAAALYAAYTLLMRRYLRHDDAATTAAFFAALGVLCCCVLAPLWLGLWVVGSSSVRSVTAQALGLALLQGKRCTRQALQFGGLAWP